MPYSTAQTRVGADLHRTRNVEKLSLSMFQGPRGDTNAPPPHPAHSSTFPESRHADNMPIPEEDEDETSSEPAEAITPTSDSHPVFSHHGEGPGGFAPSAAAGKPLIITTGATPPRSATAKNMTPTTTMSPLDPTPSSHHTKPSNSFKRLFRRSYSHTVDQVSSTSSSVAPTVGIEPATRRHSIRTPSFSLSASHTPTASQSNTPPSPRSPTSILNSPIDKQWEPSVLTRGTRSSTGFHLKDKINFGSTPRPDRDRKRSTSVNNIQGLAEQAGASKMGPGEFFSRPAETGAGLKARRMSMSLPENLVVDSVELDKEFTSASKIPGKRGRLIGKGATATVKLMTRKGHGDEVYAVKEFRKRGQSEDAEDYDKKVKSEYTIAKSLHHPNIVESVRLCTHSGRWNVVMEYCHHGELFSLVGKGYFTLEDKLCLWKQLLRGVNYLHNHGIAHRDIKLENLLLNEKGHLKITDFGVSEVFSGEHPGLREAGGQCGRNMRGVRRCAPGICGSLPYIAPEVLEKKGDYDPRPLDVWSCAIVMLTMMFQGQPWTEASRAHASYIKFSSAWDKLQADPTTSDKIDPRVPASPGPMFKAISKPALKLLILRMMNPVPEKRATIQEVIKEGWVKMIDCCAHDDVDGEALREIDASKGCKITKMVIAKSHNHQPPEKHWAPRHNFDLGDGWS